MSSSNMGERDVGNEGDPRAVTPEPQKKDGRDKLTHPYDDEPEVGPEVEQQVDPEVEPQVEPQVGPIAGRKRRKLMN